MAQGSSSGGLMPAIRALVKPPGRSENPTKPKKAQHPHFKRPGKAPNHDHCDACKEGGKLICCDRCSASFHLGCTGSPIDEEDIPIGIWQCNECKSSTVMSEEQSDVNDDAVPVSATNAKRTRNRGSSSAKKRAKAKKAKVRKEEIRKEMFMLEEAQRAEEERIKAQEESVAMEVKQVMSNFEKMSPMDMLVQAAQIMNPKYFEGNKDMKIPVPATKKDKRNQPHQSTVDPWGGNVPLPAKECYVCSKNCKYAPLLQCDYCPLLFHPDCLEPPLTSLPIGRWMCPNHAQKIDLRQVNIISNTERVALWDKFSMPVDQQAVKTDFLRNPRRNKSRFRVKVPAPPRGRIVVPTMVSKNYRKPAPLLPLRREFVRCRNVPSNPMNTTYESDEEAGMNDNSVYNVCLKSSCPKITGKGSSPQESNKPPQASTSTSTCTKPPEHTIVSSEAQSASEHSDSDFDQQVHATVMRRKAFTARNKRSLSAPLPKIRFHESIDVDAVYTAADEQLKCMDERMIKVLAWQMARQIAAGTQMGGWRQGRYSAAGSATWDSGLLNAVMAQLRSALQQHGATLQPAPAQLFEREDRERIASMVWDERTATPPPPTQPQQQKRQMSSARIEEPPPPPPPPRLLRDSFIVATIVRVGPTVGSTVSMLGEPLHMRSDSISVGTKPTCDLVLDGRCRRVSDVHAVIFRDKMTSYFELLNSSEWGTLVNGLMYGNDIAARLINGNPASTAEADAEARAAQLRSLVGRNMPPQIRVEGPLTDSGVKACACPMIPPDSRGAWEGSAVLSHGALLQFGCYKFVFSITGAVAFPYVRKNKKPAI